MTKSGFYQWEWIHPPQDLLSLEEHSAPEDKGEQPLANLKEHLAVTPVGQRADAWVRRQQRCHAHTDGDCTWAECPQEANNRANYQTVCPLSRDDSEL